MIKILLISLLFSCNMYARTVRIGVIDTGLTKSSRQALPLCKYDTVFDTTGTGIIDTHGHGTNIAHLIHKYAKNTNYCLIIIKFWDSNASNSINATISALKMVYNQNVDILNLSLSGNGYVPEERRWIRRLLSQGTVIFAAAGNNKQNLDKKCNIYPACYKGVTVVGNGNGKDVYNNSNYGKRVDIWEDGRDKTAGGSTLSGSSQATAITTGKTIALVGQSRGPSGNMEDKAIKKALEAYYKQSGLEKDVNKVVKQVRKKIPKKVLRTSEWMLPVYQAIRDRKFHYKWTF